MLNKMIWGHPANWIILFAMFILVYSILDCLTCFIEKGKKENGSI